MALDEDAGADPWLGTVAPQAQMTILDLLPAPVYLTDAEGRILRYNEAAAAFWGWRPVIGEAHWCGSWRLRYPDGSPMAHTDCPMAVAIREDRPIRGAEAMAEQPDGTRLPFLAYPTPLHDESGALVGAINMLIDISSVRRAEQHRQLLVNELNHRVKNALATVQSIALQSFGRGNADEAFRRFEERLVALSKAHDALTEEDWDSASLNSILSQTIFALHAYDRSRFDIAGPDVRLSPRTALSLAMAFHELCSNAAKFGALSNAGGRVRVSWSIARDGGSPDIRISWTEEGGPPISPPDRKGFGSRLIERGLALELGGTVNLTFPAEGVRCDIAFPLTGRAS